MDEFETCTRADLVQLVLGLRYYVHAGETELASVRGALSSAIDERDAALLLNELCHY